MAYSVDLNRPYFLGIAVSSTTDLLPVVIDGRGYLVDTTDQAGFSQRAVQVRAEQQETARGEGLGTVSGLWRRLRDSWHFGAGQERADREDSKSYMYDSSFGIDPWDRWAISLLPSTRAVPLDAVQTPIGAVELSGTVVVLMTGGVVKVVRADDTVEQHVLPSHAYGIASDGARALLGLDDGTFMHLTPGFPPQVLTGTTRPTSGPAQTVPLRLPVGPSPMIGFAKSRLLASSGNSLYDMSQPDDTGVGYKVVESLNPAFRWAAACDGPAAVYLLGGAGDLWSVMATNLKEETERLIPPVSVAELPPGEIGRSLASSMGFLMIGSDQGMRFAVTESGGSITYGRLVETPAPVLCGAGWDRFIWFGMSRMVDGWTGLGRLDLSLFTDPLTPAWATDICAPGDSDVVACGHDWFVDSNGLHRATGSPMDFGWLRTGAFDFGTPDKKRPAELALEFDDLHGTVSLRYRPDDGDWREGVEWSRPHSVTTGNIVHPGAAAFRLMEIEIGLRPADGVSPRVTLLEASAVRVPGRAMQWTVPVMVRDVVESSGGGVVRDVVKDYRHLLSLAESGALFSAVIAGEEWRLVPVDYEWRPFERSGYGPGWQGLFTLVAREVV